MNAQSQIDRLTEDFQAMRIQVNGLIAENTILRGQTGPPVAPVPQSTREAALSNEVNTLALLMVRTMQALKMPTDRPGTTPGTDSLTMKDLPAFAAGVMAELERLRARK